MTRRTAWRTATIGLGLAIALGLAAATPEPALAGSVQTTSHWAGGDRGQWSGEHRWVSPGPYWRQGPEPREQWSRRGHDGGASHQPHRGYWRHEPHDGRGHPGWWWGAPVYVPGYWAWNGWGWVWIPGHWR